MGLLEVAIKTCQINSFTLGYVINIPIFLGITIRSTISSVFRREEKKKVPRVKSVDDFTLAD